MQEELPEHHFRKLMSLGKKDLLRLLAEDEIVKNWERSNYNSVSEDSNKLPGPKIFLNYATPDVEKVAEIDEFLLSVGMESWFAPRCITPGEQWKAAIQTAIQQSDFFIVCLSSNSVDRIGFLQKEIKTALEVTAEMPDGYIYLIPLRLENCHIPGTLRHFHFLDWFEAKARDKLLWAIHKGIEKRHKGQ